MKKLFFDVETTGLSSWRNTIIQISGVIEINGNLEDKFNYFVQPIIELEGKQDNIIEEEAIETSGFTREDLESEPFEDPYEVYSKYRNLLNSYVDKYNSKDKFHIFAYNASFDDDFMRDWFKDVDPIKGKYYGSYFFTPAIDVMTMAANYLMDNRKDMENFKLMTVAKEMGFNVDSEKFHDAFYDVKVTYNIYKKIMEEVYNE